VEAYTLHDPQTMVFDVISESYALRDDKLAELMPPTQAGRHRCASRIKKGRLLHNESDWKSEMTAIPDRCRSDGDMHGTDTTEAFMLAALRLSRAGRRAAAQSPNTAPSAVTSETGIPRRAATAIETCCPRRTDHRVSE